MISVGTNITSSADALTRVKIDYLYHSLRNPKPAIVTKINQLRIIRNLNVKQYSLLKRQLPYVVCALFNPPYRKTENFAYTEYFILDIDHIYDKGMDVVHTKNKLITDSRIVLCFLSPGEDGLKIVFKLKERCYDAGLYSLFYKAFLKEFSTQYNLEQVIDERTCDVCRACFISIDKDTYYNPNAEPIDMNVYLPQEDVSSLFDLKTSLKKEMKEQQASIPKEDKSIDPDADVMLRVKSILNPRSNTKQKTEPYVPQQLDEIMGDLKQYVEETGMELYEIKNIQYGKKLRFRTGQKLAEINLFYGKHGFSVVQTPRCGTSTELNELMAQLVNSFIDTIIGYG